MAAVSEYPIGTALVRGDPVDIPADIRQDGTPVDASLYNWRSQVRTKFDGELVTTFDTSTVTTPAGSTVASTVHLRLTADESRKLAQGQVFDLEQLDKATGATIRTWWIVNKLNVQPDVSYDAPLLAKVAAQPIR